MGKFFTRIKEFINFSSMKKTSTLAGALVYFTVLGAVPTIFLISAALSLFGAEFNDAARIFLSEKALNLISFASVAANKYGSGSGIIAAAVALYSAANVLYHLRRAGEMIYNFKPAKSFVLRALTLLIMLIAIFAFAVFAFVYLTVQNYIQSVLGTAAGKIINGAAFFIISFLFVVAVNFYVCPFKTTFKEVAVGSAYTVIFSFVITNVFFFYIEHFSNYYEVYGKIASAFLALTLTYLVMKGLLSGISLNVFTAGRRFRYGRKNSHDRKDGITAFNKSGSRAEKG